MPQSLPPNPPRIRYQSAWSKAYPSSEIASHAARAILQPWVSPLPETCTLIHWLTYGSGARAALTTLKEILLYGPDVVFTGRGSKRSGQALHSGLMFFNDFRSRLRCHSLTTFDVANVAVHALSITRRKDHRREENI